MKRRDLLKAGGFGILAFALRNLPAGGAMGGSGAVTLVLYKRTSDEEDPNKAGDGEHVGWAIVSTTSNQQLRVLVTLDKGDPNAEYDIRVEIEGVYREEDVGTLSTNDRGKGSSRLLLDLYRYHGISRPTVNVQVEVGEDETDFAATATTPVQLKKKKKKKAKK